MQHFPMFLNLLYECSLYSWLHCRDPGPLLFVALDHVSVPDSRLAGVSILRTLIWLPLCAAILAFPMFRKQVHANSLSWTTVAIMAVVFGLLIFGMRKVTDYFEKRSKSS